MNTTAAAKKKSVEELIQDAKGKGHNVLLPSTNLGELSEFHQAVVDEVYLSPNPNDGDVYSMFGQDGKFALTKQALTKLSVAAGIIWNPAETRRTDNRSDRNYVSFQAVGGLRKVDGSPVYFKAEYDMDFEGIEEELRTMYENKCASWNKPDSEKKAYVEKSVRRDLLQKRKHKIKLCESGAMNRVIRWLLGVKTTYTPEELKHPFVVVRVIIRPDFSSKEVRSKMIEAAVNSIAGIYGGAPQPPQISYDNGEVIDLPQSDISFDGEESGSAPGPDESREPTERELFQDLNEDEQAAWLEGLADKKGYDLSGLPKQPAEMDARNRLRFFDHLAKMPDMEPAKEKEDDDVPF